MYVSVSHTSLNYNTNKAIYSTPYYTKSKYLLYPVSDICAIDFTFYIIFVMSYIFGSHVHVLNTF